MDLCPNSVEEWRDVPGWEGLYMVSSAGEVRNSKNHRIAPRTTENGYLRVWFSKNGDVKTFAVHRLVATAFLPNPEDLPEVNHINGRKTDNRVSNLEWCTISHNRKHSQYVLGKESGKPKRPVICVDNGWTFPSVAEAARAIRGNKQNIVKCCMGERNSHKGLHWAYAEEVQT